MRNTVNNRPRPSRWWRGAALAAIVPIMAAAGAAAQLSQPEATDTVRPASIHTGTCDRPGDLVFELRNVVVVPDSRGTLEYVGAGGASVIESSDDSELPTTFAELTRAPHLIAVFESVRSGTLIACGEIGGFTVPNDDELDIGLRAQGDSGFAGVALIDGDDDDNEVDIDLYLARNVSSAVTTPNP